MAFDSCWEVIAKRSRERPKYPCRAMAPGLSGGQSRPRREGPVLLGRPLPPRPVDRGLRRPGRPEAPLATLRVGERRALPPRAEPDPAEASGPRPVQADVAHRGAVLALVAPHVELAPPVVP